MLFLYAISVKRFVNILREFCELKTCVGLLCSNYEDVLLWNHPPLCSEYCVWGVWVLLTWPLFDCVFRPVICCSNVCCKAMSYSSYYWTCQSLKWYRKCFILLTWYGYWRLLLILKPILWYIHATSFNIIITTCLFNCATVIFVCWIHNDYVSDYVGDFQQSWATQGSESKGEGSSTRGQEVRLESKWDFEVHCRVGTYQSIITSVAQQVSDSCLKYNDN